MAWWAMKATMFADILANKSTTRITSKYKIDGICYGNGVYVATAEHYDSGYIFTSTDGISWSTNSASLYWGAKLKYLDDRFVGVGSYGTVLLSTNGTNWMVQSVQLDDNPFGDITYGNGLYVKCGASNGVAAILTSPDALTWTMRSPGSSPAGAICSIAYGLVGSTPTFVAIGNNDGNEYYSTSGTSWVHRLISSGGRQVSFANGLFIIPISAQYNLISTGGLAWRQMATGLTNQMESIFYANQIYWGSAGGYLVTSKNGTNWQQYANPLPTSLVFAGLQANYPVFATDGNRIMGVGSIPYDSWNNFYYGYSYLSEPLVELAASNSIPGHLKVSGLVGRTYQIQSSSSLESGGQWTTNGTITLTNYTDLFVDPAGVGNRFYRAAIMP